MKNYFLILALCCAVVFAGCKKDEIEITPQIPKNMEKAFPDPVFRAYVLENFDTDGDGKISKEEAEAVKRIDYMGKQNQYSDLASIKGIEYFKNLNYIRTGYNQISSIDVSKNLQLDTLLIGETKLSSLDVSKNTQLKYLNCSSNQLTTLDVSKNTQLKYLNCSGHSNQLTALDVSKNTQLIVLYCVSNQLTTLDVSKNTQLEYLHCDLNQLTTLDVSKNTQLIVLWCDHNQLTSLDVSNNTQLEYLVCYSNQLTTLDVSKTNLGNSTTTYPLLCAPMSTLKTLYLKKGWSIKCITEDNGRSGSYIPNHTEIIFVD